MQCSRNVSGAWSVLLTEGAARAATAGGDGGGRRVDVGARGHAAGRPPARAGRRRGSPPLVVAGVVGMGSQCRRPRRTDRRRGRTDGGARRGGRRRRPVQVVDDRRLDPAPVPGRGRWPSSRRTASRPSSRAIDGSGLLTGYDWLAVAAAQLVARHDPELVVVMFSGNYAPPLLVDPATGAEIAAGSPTMLRMWDAAADALMAVITAGGAGVLWVGAPPMRPGTFWETYDAVGALGPGIVGPLAAGHLRRRRRPARHARPDVHAVGPGVRRRGRRPAATPTARTSPRPASGGSAPRSPKRSSRRWATSTRRSSRRGRTRPSAITARRDGYRVVSCAGEVTDHATTDLHPAWGSVGTGVAGRVAGRRRRRRRVARDAAGQVLAVECPAPGRPRGDRPAGADRGDGGGAVRCRGTGWWRRDGGVFAFGSARVLRVDGCDAVEPADRGDGGDAVGCGVLVGGVGRRGVRVRDGAVLRVDGRRCG